MQLSRCVAVWTRRTTTATATRHMRILVVTMEGIIVLIWGVGVTGPHQQLTVTHATPTWLPSMYSSDMMVGAGSGRSASLHLPQLNFTISQLISIH